ncbi:MAG: hypothetical protein HKN87_09030 [Saprospiraceae bacterium]|nr:hypothetical protein [Saprospiraceae bacterium]
MTLPTTYIFLSAIMTFILIFLGYTGISLSTALGTKRTNLTLIILGLLSWHVYILLMSKSGLFADLSFPPKFALFLILPAFIFTGVFLFQHRHREWIQAIPCHWLILYQTFRLLIESLFVWSVARGILHPNVTIEGYNFDMIFALSAPVMGWLLWSNRSRWIKLARVWNYLGLLVIASIISLFMTTIYLPEIYGSILPFPVQFVTYPYTLVAGFLMPSAVFIHLLSLVQLHLTNSNS